MFQQQFANPFAQTLTPMVRGLLFANGVIFAIQYIVDVITRPSPLHNGMFSYWFGLHLGLLLAGAVWQPLSYMFLHGGIMHLVMNMLGLYMLGCTVERDLGSKRFLLLYLGSGIAGGAGWLALNYVQGTDGLCIGASGAVFGIIGAFAALRPNQMLTLLVFFVIPITLSARMLAIILGFISLVYTFNMDGNVAHVAHLAGGLAGYFYARNLTTRFMPEFYPSDEKKRHASRVRKTLRLIVNKEFDPPDPEEVDRILDKINTSGMESLTQAERKTLERASGAGKRE